MRNLKDAVVFFLLLYGILISKRTSTQAMRFSLLYVTKVINSDRGNGSFSSTHSREQIIFPHDQKYDVETLKRGDVT